MNFQTLWQDIDQRVFNSDEQNLIIEEIVSLDDSTFKAVACHLRWEKAKNPFRHVNLDNILRFDSRIHKRYTEKYVPRPREFDYGAYGFITTSSTTTPYEDACLQYFNLIVDEWDEADKSKHELRLFSHLLYTLLATNEDMVKEIVQLLRPKIQEGVGRNNWLKVEDDTQLLCVLDIYDDANSSLESYIETFLEENRQSKFKDGYGNDIEIIDYESGDDIHHLPVFKVLVKSKDVVRNGQMPLHFLYNNNFQKV